jgi:hypothetical protein
MWLPLAQEAKGLQVRLSSAALSKGDNRLGGNSAQITLAPDDGKGAYLETGRKTRRSRCAM